MCYTAMPIPLRLVCALVAMAGCGVTIPGVEYLEPSALGELPPLEAIPSDPNLQSYTMRGGSPSYVVGPGDRIEIRLRDLTAVSYTHLTLPTNREV